MKNSKVPSIAALSISTLAGGAITYMNSSSDYMTAVSFLIFAGVAGFFTIGFQRTTYGGIFASVILISSIEIITNNVKNPLILVFAALSLLSTYFILRGRNNVKAMPVKSRPRKKGTSNVLLNPQSGRSAVAGRTRLGSSFLTWELMLSGLISIGACMISPYGLAFAVSSAIFTLSYLGSPVKKALRSILYLMVSTLPVTVSMGIEIAKGNTGILNFWSGNTDFGPVGALTDSFVRFSIYGMDNLTDLFRYPLVVVLGLLGVFSVVGILSRIFSGRGYEFSKIINSPKSYSKMAFSFSSMLIYAVVLGAVTFAWVWQGGSLPSNVFTAFGIALALIIYPLLLDIGLYALSEINKNKIRPRKSKPLIRISVEAKKVIFYLFLLSLIIIPRLMEGVLHGTFNR